MSIRLRKGERAKIIKEARRIFKSDTVVQSITFPYFPDMKAQTLKPNTPIAYWDEYGNLRPITEPMTKSVICGRDMVLHWK